MWQIRIHTTLMQILPCKDCPLWLSIVPEHQVTWYNLTLQWPIYSTQIRHISSVCRFYGWSGVWTLICALGPNGWVDIEDIGRIIIDHVWEWDKFALTVVLCVGDESWLYIGAFIKSDGTVEEWMCKRAVHVITSHGFYCLSGCVITSHGALLFKWLCYNLSWGSIV